MAKASVSEHCHGHWHAGGTKTRCRPSRSQIPVPANPALPFARRHPFGVAWDTFPDSGTVVVNKLENWLSDVNVVTSHGGRLAG